MAKYFRYEKYQKYVNGVPTEEYKQGELIGIVDYDSKEDCESGAIYRWTDTGNTVCNGYDLCREEVKEVSKDGGNTWVVTSEKRAGEVIEKWSHDCGVVTKYRWNPTGRTMCKDSQKSEEYIYQVSQDMGNSWQNVIPEQYKYEIVEFFSDECMMEDDPFTFTFDAGEEGAELDMGMTVANQYKYWAMDGPYGYPQEPDSYKRKYYFYTNIITKCIVDWGDGSDLYKIDDTEQKTTTESVWYTSPAPEYPSRGEYIEYDIPTHIYRKGGVFTIRVWGNITKFNCQQVQEHIHWGKPMFNLRIYNSDEDMSATVRRLGLKIADFPATNGGMDGLTNFKSVTTAFQGTGFGTQYAHTFEYLKLFDMSNSKNIILAYPFSHFSSSERLETFKADNCDSLEYIQDIDQINPTLEELSLRNCPKLKRIPKILMRINTTSSRGIFFSDTTEGMLYGTNNIEEIEEGGIFYVDAVRLTNQTKLEKIACTFIQSSGINNSSCYTDMCTGLTTLQNISQLTLQGCAFDRAFKNCPNIKAHCKIIPFRNYSGSILSATQMFMNSGIQRVDMSTLFEGGSTSAYDVRFNEMFNGCKYITNITGQLSNTLFNSHNLAKVGFQSMFYNCTSLQTISPIFAECTYLPDMSYMFTGCSALANLPYNLFNWQYDMTEINIPSYMFKGCTSLANYPILDGYPIWKFPAFYNGEITLTRAFFNCTPILSAVPMKWGGYADTIPVKIKVVTTTANEIVQIPDLDNGYTDDSFIMKSESGTRLSNGRLQFASPGTYDVELYPFSYEYAVGLPKQTTSITDWGETIRLQSSYNMGALSQTKVTYLPYGNKLFSDLTSISPAVSWEFDWYQISTITDVDDNLLENCASVTVIDGELTHGAFNMNLTEEKYTTILSKLTNLERINYLFLRKVTSTCGIFKNNPRLTNVKQAFANQNLVTLPIDEFSNCKELTNVEGVFTNCTELTNMPNFRENKKITNFSNAFAGCSKLTGSTPTDENGYKLWERAGKEGYPTAIDGTHCFQGCTQLDDYNEIPDNWK